MRKTDASEGSRKEIADNVRFLKHLLQHISGKMLLIWDRLPAHRSLCQHSARVGKWQAGAEAAVHWLQVNDLDEEADRWLMNFHAAVDDTLFHLSTIPRLFQVRKRYAGSFSIRMCVNRNLPTPDGDSRLSITSMHGC